MTDRKEETLVLDTASHAGLKESINTGFFSGREVVEEDVIVRWMENREKDKTVLIGVGIEGDICKESLKRFCTDVQRLPAYQKDNINDRLKNIEGRLSGETPINYLCRIIIGFVSLTYDHEPYTKELQHRIWGKIHPTLQAIYPDSNVILLNINVTSFEEGKEVTLIVRKANFTI